jgi:hypothetical protein
VSAARLVTEHPIAFVVAILIVWFLVGLVARGER